MPLVSTNAAPLAASAFCVLLALLLPAPPAAQAQVLPGSDTVTPDSLVQRLGLPEGHAPSKALRRALMVPGWGQYYNRQYWKVPVAVAGLGGVVFGIIYSWDRYYLYRNAFRYRRSRGSAPFVPPPAEGEPDEYDGDFGGEKYEDAYRTVLADVGGQFGDDLQNAGVKDERDKFRRWGEMAILGTGVFWILQVADAYISAHLLGFDVGDDEAGENLSLHVAPSREGLSARLRLSF